MSAFKIGRTPLELDALLLLQLPLLLTLAKFVEFVTSRSHQFELQRQPFIFKARCDDVRNEHQSVLYIGVERDFLLPFGFQ